MGWLIRQIQGLYSRADTTVTLLEWSGYGKPALAMLLMVATAIAGFVQRVPIAYWMAAAATVFGMFMWGANQLALYVERRNVDGSILFERISILSGVSRSKYDETKRVHYQPGVEFRNIGQRTIYYQLDHISAAISGMTVMDPKFETVDGVIAPGASKVFRYASVDNVDVSDVPIHGVIEFSFSYGLNKKYRPYKFAERHRFRIAWHPNEVGPPTRVDSQQISYEKRA